MPVDTLFWAPVIRNALFLLGAVMAGVGLANATLGMVGWSPWFDPTHNLELIAVGFFTVLGGLMVQRVG
jgi:hypothetical protein